VGLEEQSVFRAAPLVFYVKQTISVHSSMSSLADAPDLVGFFSYPREDDEDSGGKLSKLRERIQAELRGQLGRTKADFRLWQDKTAIAHGKLWEDEIKSAIAESVFFIPIITPTAVRSHHCKFEFDSFLAREKELGRSDLVFPILYIPVPALTGDRWRQDPLLSIIGSRQYEQWQNLRQLDPSSTEVALRVEKFCANICGALQQPWLSPQERREAEARQRAEEERRRQEKLQEEARERAEEERRREEAQTKRRLDEAEAEKRRQDKERRKLEKEAAWAAKKERLHRWRGAAAGAAVLALLLVGGIWLYRTTTPAGVTSAVVQPDAPGADKAKAAAEAEAKRKAEEAEQQRLAATKAEEERKAKAAAEAEAKRKAEEAEQQRLAAAKAEEERKASTQAAVPAAQKVVLYEEDPADPNGKRFVGSAIWRTETVTPGPGQPPELAIRADVEVPERKLTMTWSLRRNTDKGLPATHTVEIMFKVPPDFPSGGISNVPGILMKQAEQTRGTPLAGLAVKVPPGFYLIGLSNVDADKDRNLQMLKERSWFDIPLVYNNNRRAILAMEKGTPGERVFADVFKAWKQ
jgi:hypothetical protein